NPARGYRQFRPADRAGGGGASRFRYLRFFSRRRDGPRAGWPLSDRKESAIRAPPICRRSAGWLPLPNAAASPNGFSSLGLSALSPPDVSRMGGSLHRLL